MIYFVKPVDAPGPIKIGFTWSNDGARLLGLQGGSPVPLELVASIPDGSRTQEGLLHCRFADFRLYGEWFNPNPDLLDLIDRLSPGPVQLPRALGRPFRRTALLTARDREWLDDICPGRWIQNEEDAA